MKEAAIAEELERLATHKIDFEGDNCFEEVTKSSIRIGGFYERD